MLLRLGKWLLGLLVLFVLLALVLWFSLPFLAEKWLPDLAREKGLREFSLSLRGIGLDGLSIRRARGVLDSPHGPLQIIIRDAVLGLGWNQDRLMQLNMDRVHVHWRQETPASADAESPIVLPDLPLARVHVKQLELDLETHAGRVNLRGELHLAHPVPNWYTASFADAAYRVSAKLRNSLRQAELVLEDNRQNRMLTVQVPQLLDVDAGARISLSAQPLLTWLTASGWLPDEGLQSLPELPPLEGRLELSRRVIGDEIHHSLRLQELTVGLQDRTVRVGLDAELVQRREQWSLRVSKPGKVSLLQPADTADAAVRVDLTLQPDLRAEFALRDGVLRGLRGDGVLDAEARIGERRLRASLTRWRIPRWDPRQGIPRKGGLHLERLAGDDLPAALPELAAQAEWTLDGSELAASGVAGPAGETWADWKIWHWLERGDGYLDATLRQPLVRVWPVMKELGGDALKGLSIGGGELDTDVHIGWHHSQGLSGRARFMASQVSGSLSALPFRELAVNGRAESLFTPDLELDLALPSLVLGNGVRITDLQLNGSLLDTLAALESASLAVFGGMLSVEPVQQVLGQSLAPLQLNARRIDLDQLFEGLGQQGLSGQGRLSGTLPVRLTAAGLQVEDAHLYTEGSGIVRYRGPGSGLQAENPNIALQALENFHYKVLDARVNYSPGGDYRIRIRLEGANPDLYDGYPIVLNLNLEGTLPGLLRDSLLSGDFSREVMKQVQGKNNSKHGRQ